MVRPWSINLAAHILNLLDAVTIAPQGDLYRLVYEIDYNRSVESEASLTRSLNAFERAMGRSRTQEDEIATEEPDVVPFG